MPDFVEAVAVDQVPPGAIRLVRVAETDVAIFNVDGEIYAINDTCVHAGSSLSAGKVDGKIVTCRSHGFRFDLKTGFVVGVEGYGVAAYPVQVVDGKIMVAIG
jgi:3-phenylpropionate/trans-cinnamate dioxygenase ferredoxin subunit